MHIVFTCCTSSCITIELNKQKWKPSTPRIKRKRVEYENRRVEITPLQNKIKTERDRDQMQDEGLVKFQGINQAKYN